MSFEAKNSQNKLFASFQKKEKKTSKKGLFSSNEKTKNEELLKSFLKKSEKEISEETPEKKARPKMKPVVDKKNVKPRYKAKELTACENLILKNPLQKEGYLKFIKICKENPDEKEGETELLQFLEDCADKNVGFSFIYDEIVKIYKNPKCIIHNKAKLQLEAKKKMDFFSWLPDCCLTLKYSKTNYSLFKQFSEKLFGYDEHDKAGKLAALGSVAWKVLIKDNSSVSAEFMVALLITYSKQVVVRNSPLEKSSQKAIEAMLDELAKRSNEREFVFTGTVVIKSDLFAQLCEICVSSYNEITLNRCLEIIKGRKTKLLDLKKMDEKNTGTKLYTRLVNHLWEVLKINRVNENVFDLFEKVKEHSMVPNLMKYIEMPKKSLEMKCWALFCLTCLITKETTEEIKKFVKEVFTTTDEKNINIPKEMIPFGGFALFKITNNKTFVTYKGFKKDVPASIVWFLKAARLDDLWDKYNKAKAKEKCRVM